MTDTYIRDIAYISKITGEIIKIQLAPINYPGEGDDDTNEWLYIKHIMSDFEWPAYTHSEQNFMEKYFWNFATSSWVYRGPRPNVYSFWTANQSWDWDDSAFLNAARRERNIKLAMSDWTQVADAPLTSEQVIEATAYRQELRNITTAMISNPENYSTPESIPWPAVPAFLA